MMRHHRDKRERKRSPERQRDAEGGGLGPWGLQGVGGASAQWHCQQGGARMAAAVEGGTLIYVVRIANLGI
jgi:hypothetical protein